MEKFPKCPFCNSTKNSCLKTWKYGTYGAVLVSLLKCSCGKTYNFYLSPKNNWTIPKRENILQLKSSKEIFRY